MKKDQTQRREGQKKQVRNRANIVQHILINYHSTTITHTCMHALSSEKLELHSTEMALEMPFCLHSTEMGFAMPFCHEQPVQHSNMECRQVSGHKAVTNTVTHSPQYRTHTHTHTHTHTFIYAQMDKCGMANVVIARQQACGYKITTDFSVHQPGMARYVSTSRQQHY